MLDVSRFLLRPTVTERRYTNCSALCVKKGGRSCSCDLCSLARKINGERHLIQRLFFFSDCADLPPQKSQLRVLERCSIYFTLIESGCYDTEYLQEYKLLALKPVMRGLLARVHKYTVCWLQSCTWMEPGYAV